MRFNRGKRYTYYSSYSSSRRSRIRWDRIAIIGAVVILIIGVVVWFNFSRIQLAFKGYSFAQQNEILALDGDGVEEILSHDKLEHITQWLKQSEKVQYYDEYEKYLSLHKNMEVAEVISTVDNIFENYVPKLTTLNYSNDQIWEVLKTAGINEVKHLVDQQYTYAQIEPFMKVKGFVFADIDQYMKVYKESQNYNYAVLITTYPFIISENKVDQSYTIQNPDDILTLVKKGFYLPEDYEPELVDPEIPVAPDCQNPKMTKETSDALTKMYKAAKQEGLELVVNSAYRSYQTQVETMADFVARYNTQYANEYVAQPGASEHQTGLGVDLTSQSVVEGKRITFGDTEEYRWVIKNCARFGFIIRFEDGTDGITGIAHEPWHLRYVGEDVAKEIQKNGWTFEEYCLYNNVMPEVKEQ